METDFKQKIKTEPVDQYVTSEETRMEVAKEDKTNGGTVENGLDDEVAQEFSVVLLRPNSNETISRMLFEQMQPRKLESCTSRLKQQVKHLELTYQTPRNHEGEPKDGFASLFDGVYNGENVNKNETLARDAVGFFKEGRFYMLPVTEAYDMHRKINKPKKKDEEDNDLIDRTKLEDSKLNQVEAAPSANPLRVSYAKNETEWQKKRREQSAQFKQQAIDNDPWIPLPVKKSKAKHIYEERIVRSQTQKPATVDPTQKLPVL